MCKCIEDSNKSMISGNGIEVRVISACINTVSHGSFCISEFTGSREKLEAQTQDAEFSVKRYSEGGISLFGIKAALKHAEDHNGNLITFPEKDAAKLELEFLDDTSEKEDGSCHFMAVSQHKPWWTRPCFVTDTADIPEKTQLLVCRRGEEDSFLVMMAVCSDNTRTDIRGTEGGISISVSSNMLNGTSLDEASFACGAGPDPYAIIGKIYELLLKNRTHTFKLRKEKQYPELFRSPGWCTWDSLGQNVREKDIFLKMDELREKQIPVRWVLIDDGWSLVDRETKKLKSFHSDSEKFPGGLTQTVTQLKNEYGVEAVGVWQASKGYWCGVADDFREMKEAGEYLRTYGNGEISVKPDAASSFGFWDTWHSMLERAGIDFVKIDGQSSMQVLQKGVVSYGEGLQGFYKGMEASVFLHFGGKVMNCMGMAPESVFNRSATAISRTSDDYLPTVSGSLYEHALQNAYNNVYQGDLYFGDFDMFWTEHEDADRSALLRMISGGPVYFSDACGHTDPEVVRKMTGSSGKLLMCDDIGRPTLDCLADGPFSEASNGSTEEKGRTEDENQKKKDGRKEKDGILKMYNRCQDTYVIACFAGDQKTAGTVKASDIPGTEGRTWMLVNVKTGETALMSSGKGGDGFRFEIDAREALVLEMLPADRSLALAGVMEKYIPAAGAELGYEGDEFCDIRMHAEGTLAFTAQRAVKRVCAEGKELEFTAEGGLVKVKVGAKDREIRVWLE